MEDEQSGASQENTILAILNRVNLTGKKELKGPRDLESEAAQRLVAGGRPCHCTPGVGARREAVEGPEAGAHPPCMERLL